MLANMSRPYSCPLASSRTRRLGVANMTGIAVLLALPATAEAASPLRPPSDAQRASILSWADRHLGRLNVDRFGALELGTMFGGAQWATRTRLDRHDLFNPPCQTFGTRGLNTAFSGLTANGVIRRLVSTGEPLATAQGLRIGDNDPPRRRVIMTDQDDLVVEVSVGFRPEVDFDEGCA